MTIDDILDQILPDEEAPMLPLADNGIRFVNFFIDRLVLFGGSFLFGFFLMDWIFGAIIGTFYYSLFEYLSGGRTIGKLLTGTMVVSEDGRPLTYPQVLGRTLMQFVPFEPFSFFGKEPIGWHDSASGTRVVKVG